MDLLQRRRDDVKLLAGGTDIVVQMKQGNIAPGCLLDLKKIPDFKRIRILTGKSLVIGALATVAEIHASAEVNEHLPAISEAAGVIGSVQIRNRATIGGNICHAAPSGDFPPILMAFDSRLRVFGSGGEKSVLVKDFFLGPRKTILRPNEILLEIEIPIPKGMSGAVYLRHSLRDTLDLATVSAAVFLELNPNNRTCVNARIALASVAPTPIRAPEAEALLAGRELSKETIRKAAKTAAEEARPRSDVYGDDWYKKVIVEVLVRRAILESIQRCK
jgi:carbon-monoxide dehydrogenase medium subunit